MFVASTLSTQITQSLYSHKITTHSEVQCRLRNIKDILRLNASYWNGYAIAMHWLSFDWMFEYISAILSEMQSAPDENTKTNRRCLVNKSSDPNETNAQLFLETNIQERCHKYADPKSDARDSTILFFRVPMLLRVWLNGFTFIGEHGEHAYPATRRIKNATMNFRLFSLCEQDLTKIFGTNLRS